jgi:hypothetical protein
MPVNICHRICKRETIMVMRSGERNQITPLDQFIILQTRSKVVIGQPYLDIFSDSSSVTTSSSEERQPIIKMDSLFLEKDVLFVTQ